MTDEITPIEEVVIEEDPIEAVSEPVKATIPSEPVIPAIKLEPTAQIPVNEPLDIPTKTEAEPITETIQVETEPAETEIQSESVFETIPESVPQITPEPAKEVKPEISEPTQTESTAANTSSTSSAPSASQSTEIPETKIESEKETKPEPDQPKVIPVIIPKKNLARELLVKARNAIQFRKRKKLDKVMSLFLKHSKIKNDEVEKFMHVSDATATRYLNTLEKENKIKQNGKTGKSVFYSKI